MRAIGLAGGRWIVLSPEGFGEGWRPSPKFEKFCAEGRISLFHFDQRGECATQAEIEQRCQEMNDLVAQVYAH